MPEAAKARGRKGEDSQKQNLKVRGVHSVFTAQRYQKWLKTGVVARPKQIDLLHPKEMVKKRPEPTQFLVFLDLSLDGSRRRFLTKFFVNFSTRQRIAQRQQN